MVCASMLSVCSSRENGKIERVSSWESELLFLILFTSLFVPSNQSIADHHHFHQGFNANAYALTLLCASVCLSTGVPLSHHLEVLELLAARCTAPHQASSILDEEWLKTAWELSRSSTHFPSSGRVYTIEPEDQQRLARINNTASKASKPTFPVPYDHAHTPFSITKCVETTYNVIRLAVPNLPVNRILGCVVLWRSITGPIPLFCHLRALKRSAMNGRSLSSLNGCHRAGHGGDFVARSIKICHARSLVHSISPHLEGNLATTSGTVYKRPVLCTTVFWNNPPKLLPPSVSRTQILYC